MQGLTLLHRNTKGVVRPKSICPVSQSLECEMKGKVTPGSHCMFKGYAEDNNYARSDTAAEKR